MMVSLRTVALWVFVATWVGACGSSGSTPDVGAQDATGLWDGDLLDGEGQGGDGTDGDALSGDLLPSDISDSSEPPLDADSSGDIEPGDVQPDVCVPDCESRECGDDGCGGSCGQCVLCGEVVEDVCVDGQCPQDCCPDCEGRVCGDDGCGGSCGQCDEPLGCVEGECQCVPDCEGKNCGDDGCGGSCGTCVGDAWCLAGVCSCVEDCTGKACGDDGCGGSCGTCDGQDTCVEFECVCQPACVNKNCGPDGCGGNCGTCEGQDLCLAGVCECQPDCAGLNCGDDGCGGSCGTCLGLDQCVNGRCSCVPQCEGKECGDDECGGQCGYCTGQFYCQAGNCVCAPNCLGKQCGDDGCGGVCGDCPAPYACEGSTCVCQPDCDGKNCGGDLCGGSCGTCSADEACVEGVCECVPQCLGKTCGDDGCGGSCGNCPDHAHCGVAGHCLCDDVTCEGVCCPPSEVCFGSLCCLADCEGKECGDDGCGGICGVCQGLAYCQDSLCVCDPDCEGKECGDDGCGGSCGECSGQDLCEEALCICQPECGFRECGADGCGGDCGTCSGTQLCALVGLCAENTLAQDFRFGVVYHSVSNDLEQGAFLGRYDNPAVSSEVKQQLTWMGDEGVRVVTTHLWLDTAEGTDADSGWQFDFPPSDRQLESLRAFVQDAAVIGAYSGAAFDLQIGVFYSGCSDYSIGTPSTTLGDCALTPEQYEERLMASWTGILGAVSDVYRPNNGLPCVSVVYVDSDVRVALDAADPLAGQERTNQRWFLQNYYASLVGKVREAGLIPSLRFTVETDDVEAMNNAYVDSYQPPASQRAGAKWIHRGIAFLKAQGLPVPSRIDMSFFPSPDFAWSNMPSLVHRLVKDIDYLVTAALGVNSSYEFVGTWYPSDPDARAVLAATLAEERSLFGSDPDGVSVWSTPFDVPGSGAESMYPWEPLPWLGPEMHRVVADLNPSMELDQDADGLPDGWQTVIVAGPSATAVSRYSSSTGIHDGINDLMIQSAPCASCTYPGGVWVQSDPVVVVPGTLAVLRFWEKNSVTPTGGHPPATNFKGCGARLIGLTSDSSQVPLDEIAFTYGLMQWREHMLAAVIPDGVTSVVVQFGMVNGMTTTQTLYIDDLH